MDIKNRQTIEERRKNILNEYKPKEKEKERIKCFNRLINDSNKRYKIKENIERQNEFLSAQSFERQSARHTLHKFNSKNNKTRRSIQV